MLKHLPCVRVEPTLFCSQPISSDMDERTVRFELERRACQSLRKVLQLKLQQRRTREELVNQGIMPPLKSSASFHKQKQSLERAQTEDYLKRKIKSRPERSELIRMHILEETSAEPSLQARQMQLKRARLADNLNDKISHRPGPMELIHKNIFPVHSSIKRAIIETEFSKASGENSSYDEDSNDSLSPEVSQDSPLPSPIHTLGQVPSPVQVPPSVPPQLISDSTLKLTNALPLCAQKIDSLIKNQQKINATDRSVQRYKKPKDDKPKIKKLKYHQYIPPDQKGDKEAPPKLDSSYAKILQQQQLFLQLQILNQQQQNVNHQTNPLASAKHTDEEQSNSTVSQPVDVPMSLTLSGSAEESKPLCLPTNLDELKVAELKAELKLRGLTVSGTKNDLIERLRAYKGAKGGRESTAAQTAGGAKELGAEGASKVSKTAANINISLSQKMSSIIKKTAGATSTLQLKTCGDNSSKCVPFTSPDDSEDRKCKTEALEKMTGPPLTQLDFQPPSQLIIRIKEEQPSTAPTSCQLSLKPVYIHKCRLVQSTSSEQKTKAFSNITVDKDRMLQEKDRQIEELKKMLMHNQRLVDLLRMKLEKKRSEEMLKKTETLLLLRVKEEPPDKTNEPSVEQPFSVSDVKVKQEVTEEDTMQSLVVQPEIKAELTSGHSTEQQHTALQLAQQQAVHRLLLQQSKLHNQMHTSYNQKVESQHKQQKLCMSQEKKKKSQRHVLQQHQQQITLKQQILLKQQKDSVLQQQPKESPQIQIQTSIELKQKKDEKPQVTPVCLNQSGLNAILPVDLMNNSTPAIVTDSNGNHFLITLTSQFTDNQAKAHLENKASKHIMLQRLPSSPSKLPGHSPAQLPQPDNQAKAIMHTGGLKQQTTKAQCRGLQTQQEVVQSSVASSFSKENVPSETNMALTATQNKLCPGLDFLFSPLSPAASSPDAKDTENEDFIDTILQTGDISSFRPSTDPALAHLHCSASPPSALKLLQSAPSLDPHHPGSSASHTTTDQKNSGRLEDFLESTTGKPLLGVEPDGPLTLIDDLHSQMLCTPSILDHPTSPMDTLDTEPSRCRDGVDSMDWLDLTMEEKCSKDLATPTPPSVFSTDFLDSYDLETAWDSCL